MKITNIKISQKTNLGNYESLDFGAEAVISEDDSINDATTKLTDFVDWHAQKPIRDAKAREYRKILGAPNATEAAKAEATRWLTMYDERQARVAGL